MNEVFNKDYLSYFKKAVEKSLDGTTVPGPAVCNEYVKLLDIQPDEKVLDLGCSYGRLFPVFAQYTSAVYGIDVDLDVVNEASSMPYSLVVLGKAESIPLPSNFFNHVIAWGVFDVLEQLTALKEINRILKPGGKFLVTAKNANYADNDVLAFNAERNAKLKSFPNRFTELEKMSAALPQLGFELEKLFFFEKRGDLGLNKVTTPAGSPHTCYEYVGVLRKTAPFNSTYNEPWTLEFSRTAERLSNKAGFGKDILSFFKDSKSKDA